MNAQGGLEYRRGVDADHVALQSLFATENELSGYAADAIGDAKLVAWLALEGERLVGAILTRPMIDERGARRGGVDELLVAASHRRRGIGRSLMELAEGHYRTSGAAGMQLTVRAGNAPAEALYQSLGYAVAERRLRMRKEWGDLG